MKKQTKYVVDGKDYTLLRGVRINERWHEAGDVVRLTVAEAGALARIGKLALDDAGAVLAGEVAGDGPRSPAD